LSIFLLYSHILYGGYYIVSSENKTDYIVALIAPIILGGLVVMVYYHAYPMISYGALIILFLFAILFHRYYASQLTQICLQEFCHYKMFIEVYGIVLSLVGILSLLFFPSWSFFLAIMGVYFVLRLNWLIFIKKDLYHMRYSNPVLSQNPMISIVLTTDHEGHGLETVLASIQSQTYKQYEVILVGDQHIDLIGQTAEKFLHRVPIRMVHDTMGRPAHARNLGAAQAQGELVLFVDADVVFPPDFLEKSVALFHHRHLALAGFALNGKEWYISLFQRWLRLTQYYHPRASTSCLMVLRSLHERIRFDEAITMFVDDNYVQRASAKGKYRFISEIKVSVFHSSSQHPVWHSIQYLVFEIYRHNFGEIRFSHAPSSGKKEGAF
jgi:GT2 family glycosyltransferase